MRDLDCLSKLSDAELGTWLSRINMSDLARCLPKISPDSQKRIQQHQSERTRALLVETIEAVKDSSMEEISESEELLVEALPKE